MHLLILSHHCSWYLHKLNKALWCLTDMTRSARCDISSAGRWLDICGYRCLPLGVGCCCRASGCSLLGCCGSNRWLYCGSSRCLLIFVILWAIPVFVNRLGKSLAKAQRGITFPPAPVSTLHRRLALFFDATGISTVAKASVIASMEMSARVIRFGSLWSLLVG